VDIASWLFDLTDAGYQCCSHAHIAAGVTATDDGTPMSINVETIGDSLVVQHYVGEVRDPHLCRMVSLSDGLGVYHRTKVQVVRELSANRIGDETCEYSNHIHASATDEFIAFIEKYGISFAQAKAALRTRTIGKRRRTSSIASNTRPHHTNNRRNSFRKIRRLFA
jgi:hypothetical protein